MEEAEHQPTMDKRGSLSSVDSVQQCALDDWQFGVAVTRWSRSTQLLYIKPG